MTRKWLAVFMLIFLAPAVVFVLSGCGGGGEGGTGRTGSVMPVSGEPVYDWTKKFGGEFSDHGRAVATDSSGNIYIAGSFTGLVNFAADFDGAETKTSYGNTDIFVTRIKANGTHDWTKQIGGADNNVASDIAVDSSGNVYVAGYFEGTVNFKADFSGVETKTSYENTADIFVTKINANGTYGWTKQIGGTGHDKASGIAVDTYGNVYVAGSFSGYVNFAADFGGTSDKTSLGNTDIFVTKLNADGTHAWTKQMGGAGNDGASGIAVDADDNVYVVGYFEGTVDFRADFIGAWDYKISVGLYDAFVTKLSSNGTYGWTKRIGGTGNDKASASGIAVDTSGNVYIAGSFWGEFDFADDFSGHSDLKTSADMYNAFVTKLSPSGDYFWTKRIGGAGNDGASGITVDAHDNVYVAGYFSESVNFAADFGGTSNKTSLGNTDIFVTKIDANGTYGWTKRIGGADNDKASGIAVDADDNVYIAGSFRGGFDFADDFAGEPDQGASHGDEDIFITMLTADGDYGWTRRMGGVDDDYGLGITVNQADVVYMTGFFTGSVYFGSDFGKSDFKRSSGQTDVFLTKITP